MPARAHGGSNARRRWSTGAPRLGALLVLCLLLVAACGSGSESLSSAGQRGDVEPVRVTVAGDSIMRELSAPLQAALDQPGVEVDFALLPALASPSMATDTALLLDEHEPDVVLMMIGTWEGVGVDTRVEGWEERYEANVLAPFVTQLADADVDLVWLGYPPFPPSPEHDRHSQLNSAYAALPERHPSVTYVPAGDAVAAPDGSYLEVVDIPDVGPVTLRQSDGRHLCPDGAVLMAEATLAHLHERFDLSSVEGWQRAPWRNDPENFEHPELCPGLVAAGSDETTTAAATSTTLGT